MLDLLAVIHIASAIALFAGVILLTVGFRGLRIDGHPLCRSLARLRIRVSKLAANRKESYTFPLMINKRKARELALQLLFLWDAHDGADPDLSDRVALDADVPGETRQAGISMAHAAWEHRAASDAWLEKIAPQWPVKRQPGVDRGILRLSVWELTLSDTPPKVVIDEAIELAKIFSTENSPAFVNGVLDAVLKESGKLSAE